jgi:predicted ATPase/class 3 adenylate cyclase
MQPTRKIAAIMSADVVGYSRLMGADDLATMQDIVATRKLATQHVQAHQGRMVDTAGDSMLADFASAVQALHCAVALQQELAQRNALRAEARRMVLRIGLNIGDILEQDAALYGDAVNLAARLQALGEPGGVCVSAAMLELVQGRLPVAFEFAGEHEVKNITKPVGMYHVRFAGSPVAQGNDTHEPAPLAGPHNLPQALSSFIGREHEISAAKALLTEHRLLTLVGPGGIGKTRLGVQVAAAMSPQFSDGVWLVELAALADARLVPQALASVLGVKEVAGKPLLPTLQAALKHKRLLVLLDNCEHVTQACAELAAQLLLAAPHLKLLATSREPLHLAGEINYPVPVLSLPSGSDSATAAALREFEAIRLFVDRASAKVPGFTLSDAAAPHVLRICQCLDGLPLAIELAAARVNVLSVEQIASRLKDRFSLLTRGDRSAMPRQQALRALIDWSHDLLDAKERAVLRRLSVFAGGWTLDMAEAVVAGDGIEANEVADLLARLVEKSLVMMGEGGARYRLLETMRQYAGEQLDATAEGDATRDRHLDCYVALAERARPHLTGAQQGKWLAQLDLERENFLAARAWCNRSGNGGESALRLLIALKLYLYSRGLLELLRWSTLEALELPGAQERSMLRSRALHTVGQVCYFMALYADAMPHLLESLAIAKAHGDIGRVAIVLQEMGSTALGLGDVAGARGHLQEAVTLARQSGDKRATAAALNAMAQIHRSCGQFGEAAPLYTESLRLARELGDEQTASVTLLNLAILAIGRGDAAEARLLLRQAHATARTLDSPLTGQCVLAVASGLAALRDDWHRVGRLSAAADTVSDNLRIHLDPSDMTALQPLWRRAEAAIGSAAYLSARASGADLSYEQAMEQTGDWLRLDG